MKGVIDVVSDIAEAYASKFSLGDSLSTDQPAPNIHQIIDRSIPTYVVMGENLERKLKKEKAYVRSFTLEEQKDIQNRLGSVLAHAQPSFALGHTTEKDRIYGSLIDGSDGHIARMLAGDVECAVILDETASVVQTAICTVYSGAQGNYVPVKYELIIRNGKEPEAYERGEELRFIPHKRWHDLAGNLNEDLQSLAQKYGLRNPASLRLHISMIDEFDSRGVKPDGSLVAKDHGAQPIATKAYIEASYRANADDIGWDGPIEDTIQVNQILKDLEDSAHARLKEIFALNPKRASYSLAGSISHELKDPPAEYP